MTLKKYYTFMIDPDLADALKVTKARDGISESEQIRRALREWFKQGLTAKRGDTRGRTGARKKGNTR